MLTISARLMLSPLSNIIQTNVMLLYAYLRLLNSGYLKVLAWMCYFFVMAWISHIYISASEFKILSVIKVRWNFCMIVLKWRTSPIRLCIHSNPRYSIRVPIICGTPLMSYYANFNRKVYWNPWTRNFRPNIWPREGQNNRQEHDH